MDELQISGKRYISSRRIARDNGYHTDYIGQLIRGNKIKGQKVGRTWYVDAESFDTYLGGEGVVAPEKTISTGYSDSVATESPEVASPSLGKPPAEIISPTHTPAPMPVAAVVVEQKIEPVKIIEVKEEQKVEIKKVVEPVAVQARYVPVASGGLRFVADDEPLLPEISSKEIITRVMPVVAAAATPTESQVEAVVFERRPHRARIFFALGGLAVLIFIFTAVVSSTVFEKINIEAGNPASVQYGVNW